MPKPPSQDILLIPFYSRLINHFVPRVVSLANKRQKNPYIKQKTNLEIHIKIKSQANSEKGPEGRSNPPPNMESLRKKGF